MSAPPLVQTVDLAIAGMDCAECTRHVEQGLRAVPGVREVRVLLQAERATVTLDPAQATRDQLERAVVKAGYAVRPAVPSGIVPEVAPESRADRLGGLLSWGLLGLVAVVVLLAAVGEWVGVFDAALDRVPWWIPAAAIAIGGGSVFWGVIQAAWRRQITSHTLMTVGVLAAVAIGEWTTAAVIVFFMRFAAWLEARTTERGRQALRELAALQPVTARVRREGRELELPLAEVVIGDVVLVRPGERIPVDGTVLDGQAPVDEASITGESMPVEKAAGDAVFATSIAQAGFLQVATTGIGVDTTFGRIVRLVEEAESNKAPVQRFADRFATWYLPLILLVAGATFLLTGAVLNAVAVLVVACACAITIATPVVVLASTGQAARQGLLIKGGIALEQLARVTTVVLDKTGTVTGGRPLLTEVLALNGRSSADVLRLAATIERRSEHPVAEAVVAAAGERGLELAEPSDFAVLPGRGVLGTVGGEEWLLGNRRLLAEREIPLGDEAASEALRLEAAGATTFFLATPDQVEGVLAVSDVLRPEVLPALAELRQLGVTRLLLLTGDSERVAAAIAGELGIEYQAGLLPEEKIAVIQWLQAAGEVVMMVGDGVNDAPALTQADVGVAMGAGAAVSLEAAGVALIRNDWAMVPEAIRIGRRSVRTIRQNLGFTAAYNVIGVALAAVGILPPVWAAAAQSLPDVAIMLNSSRLLRPASRRILPPPRSVGAEPAAPIG
ncbi:MAG: cation-translocating P-type ATPase [Chloroflexia bacterium]|nr:cation-translocating P-type ATPase [Chloroflexia bacterium]